MDILIQPEDFAGVACREHLAVVAIEGHPADCGQGFEPGKASGQLHSSHGRPDVWVVVNEINIIVNEAVDPPAVGSYQSARGCFHGVIANRDDRRGPNPLGGDRLGLILLIFRKTIYNTVQRMK